MNNLEYEATYKIIRRMFVLAASQVKEPSKKLNLQFIYYGENVKDENIELRELISKALELDDSFEITNLETSRFNEHDEPGYLCKCLITSQDKYIVSEGMILGNELYNLKHLVLQDIVHNLLVKHARDNIAISMLTGKPYFICFEFQDNGLDELLSIIKPHYESVKKDIESFSDILNLKLEIVKDESSGKIKMVIHLCFV